MTGRWMDDRQRQDPSSGGDPRPALDDLDVDRLLDRLPEGPDAVPGYANLAEVLAAAAGPARPDELAGEASALAAFRAARDAATAPRGSATTATSRRAHPGHAGTTQVRSVAPRRRAGLAGRRRRAPAMVVALAIVIGGLCASATAAVVTMTRRPANTVASSTAPPAGPGSTLAVPPGGDTAPTTSGPPLPRGNVTGPGAPRHDRASLCTAWRAGNGNGAANRQQHARAFQELAEAAGGADRVEEYCRGATPPTSPPKGKGGSGDGKARTEEREPQSAESGGAAGASKAAVDGAKGLDMGLTETKAAAPGATTDAQPSDGPSLQRPGLASSVQGPEHSRG